MNKTVKVALIVAAALAALGLVLCLTSLLRVGFNTEKLKESVQKLEKQESELPADFDSQITVITAYDDILVTVSPDDKIHLSWFDRENDQYVLSSGEAGCTLSQRSDANNNWLQRLVQPQLNIQPTPVTLALPASFSGPLALSSASGHISLSAYNGQQLTLSTASGKIDLNGLSTDTLSVGSASGAISLTDVQVSGMLELTDVSGAVRIESSACDTLHLKNTSGSVTLEGFTAAASLQAKTATGAIRFNALACPDLLLESVSGEIRGTVTGSAAAYTVEASSVSGSVSLPDQTGGPNQLHLISVSGSIDVNFTEK